MKATGGGASGVAAPRWLTVGLVASTFGSLYLAFAMTPGRADPRQVVVAAVAAGFLAVVITLRGARGGPFALLMVIVGAVLAVRLGSVTGAVVTRDVRLFGWIACTLTTLVLVHRLLVLAYPSLEGTTPARPGATRSVGGVAGSSTGAGGPGFPPRPAARRLFDTVRSVTLTTGAVILVALLLWPLVASVITPSASLGEGPRTPEGDSAGTSLMSRDRLDMTTRPEPTDEILMRITSERAGFWRGQVFDRWDGRHWTRADSSLTDVGPEGEVFVSLLEQPRPPEISTTQKVRIEASYSDLIFGSASPSRVEAPVAVAQHRDGTLAMRYGAMGRGATYTVESTSLELSPQRLRAAEGPLPVEITDRYTQEPVITDRVRAAALEATAGATTTYDKIRALEEWMGERTEYSLEAPMAPEGVDVVDHFLFESRRGWCQQVASSLVVMARANGIPARLATGFVPGDRERLTGTWIVRAREAHAWTEVWFPEVGWVTFDPTAEVPLAPPVEPAETLLDRLWENIVLIVVVLVAVVAAAVGGRALWRLIARRRRDAAAGPPSWARRADQRLTGEGDRLGRPRRPAESTAAYARALGDHVGMDVVGEVGLTVDRHLYAPTGPAPAEESSADQILDELAVLTPPGEDTAT